MSRLNINNLTNENEDGSPKISGISTFSSTHYFVPPSGTTAERPSHADAGMIRFNTDSGHLEYYNGVEWTSVIVNNNELGISNNAAGTSGGLGHRGIFGGGADGPTSKNDIEYVTISTLGNSIDFGTLNISGAYLTSCSSSTRGIFFNGQNSTAVDYITISSTGNGTSFVTASNDYNQCASCSNEIRGFRAGGSDAGVTYNNIYYVTIATTGTFVDFGDLSSPSEGRLSFQAVNSSTRGIFSGGRSAPSQPVALNTIDYITMMSLGNAQDFGDLTQARRYLSPTCNATRGIFAGGYAGPSPLNAVTTIDFITMASIGNAQDFGDLQHGGNTGNNGNCSSPTRGLFTGAVPSNTLIEYLTISTTGNAKDFGDLNTARRYVGSCSNGAASISASPVEVRLSVVFLRILSAYFMLSLSSLPVKISCINFLGI